MVGLRIFPALGTDYVFSDKFPPLSALSPVTRFPVRGTDHRFSRRYNRSRVFASTADWFISIFANVVTNPVILVLIF